MTTLKEKLSWTVSCLMDAKAVWGDNIDWNDLSFHHQGSYDEGEVEIEHFCLNTSGINKVTASFGRLCNINY